MWVTLVENREYRLVTKEASKNSQISPNIINNKIPKQNIIQCHKNSIADKINKLIQSI